MTSIPESTPGAIGVWWAAARPRTLPAAIVPILVGLAVASREGAIDGLVAIATLGAALLIQIGTNLANDYFDFLAGADTADRLGPTRVTQAGLVEPHRVRAAALGVLGLAAAIGLFLVTHGGWPILAIGVASLLLAIAYTGGPFPLAYHGLGDPFVFVFFGVVAVTGTTYLQTGTWSGLALLASVPVGALATAILVVNNLRDIPTDRVAGKRTLAVRFGAVAARAEHLGLIAIAFASLGALALATGPAVLAPALTLPIAVFEIRGVGRDAGAALNARLAGTARLHLFFGALLALGIAIA